MEKCCGDGLQRSVVEKCCGGAVLLLWCGVFFFVVLCVCVCVWFSFILSFGCAFVFAV